jgi:hypothetical protein
LILRDPEIKPAYRITTPAPYHKRQGLSFSENFTCCRRLTYRERRFSYPLFCVKISLSGCERKSGKEIPVTANVRFQEDGISLSRFSPRKEMRKYSFPLSESVYFMNR